MMKFKIAVWSLCYNHSPYLWRTLDGLSSQVTDFDYVAVVIDDASTDGSQEEIRNYLDKYFQIEKNDAYRETNDAIIYYGQHKENIHFFLSVVFLKYNHYQIKKSKAPFITEWTDKAEYWALCECDDYWIDQNKLQEESDFLDRNSEYGLVYTDYDIHYYDTGKYVNAVFKNGMNSVITSFEQHLIHAGYIAPMSWLCRIPFSSLMNGYQGPDSIDLSFIIALEVFLHSKVYYLDKVTCVYGKHSGSATKQTSIANQYAFAHGAYSTQKYFLEKYELREKYPTCLDYFINAYYCFIIANQKEEDYSEVLFFFHRKGKTSLKFLLFEKMMSSKFTMPLLRILCKQRISKKR